MGISTIEAACYKLEEAVMLSVKKRRRNLTDIGEKFTSQFIRILPSSIPTE